mgnify:CR=1 FL=1|tara:strand:+ start:4724 stop:5452 length:729 start_codon:yes stop_codon:yes gene_type:complete
MFKWFKCHQYAWEHLISHAEKPLPQAVVEQDLLALDTFGRELSQRELAERWGWSRAKVRWHVREVERGTKTTTQQQPKHIPVTAQSQPKVPAVVEGLHDAAAQSHPEATQAHPSSSPAVPIESKNRLDQKESNNAFHTVAAFWKKHRPKGPALIASRGQGRLIKARLKDHSAEDVIAVLRWALISDDRQAVWLRENKYCRLSTLLGSSTKFEGYLESSAQAATSGQRGQWTDYDDPQQNTPF